MSDALDARVPEDMSPQESAAAMQAGLVSRKLTFREIFASAAAILLLVLIVLERQ